MDHILVMVRRRIVNIQLLDDYINIYQKIWDNPYSQYDYERARYWKLSLEYILHPNAKNVFPNFIPYPMAKIIYNNQGLEGLINVCKEEDNKYESYIKITDSGMKLKRIKKRTKECLICQASGIKLEKCDICNTVPICHECKINSDFLVRYLMFIHSNPCSQNDQ
jgi:hypothetical protein